MTQELTDGHAADSLSATRRDILAASGALALGGVLSANDGEETTVGADSTPVLVAADLVERDAYVEWEVDADASALVRHLRARVDSFEGVEGAATAFVSSGADGIPQYVESATFEDAAAWPAVGEATAAWFAAQRDATATAVRQETDVLTWRIPTGEGTVDAVRLDRIADRVVVTVVGGEIAALLDPVSAARRYAAVVRGRVASQ